MNAGAHKPIQDCYRHLGDATNKKQHEQKEDNFANGPSYGCTVCGVLCHDSPEQFWW